MIKKWFYLMPDVFLWTKNESGLIYNSKTGRGYKFTNNGEIALLTAKLQDHANLYCIEMTCLNLKDKELNNFIEKVIKSKSGNMLDLDEDHPTPVILPPLLNLQSDVERLRKESPEMIGENVLDNLIEIFIHVNGLKYRSNEKKNLEFPKIKSLLDSISFSTVGRIHILGEDIMAYPDIIFLLDILDKMKLKKSFHIRPEVFEKHNNIINYFKNKQSQLVIEINGFVDFNMVPRIDQILKDSEINLLWIFFISNESEHLKAENIIEQYQIESVEIKPLYNGENLKFFEDYIFLTEADLKHSGLTKREVFAHQALNTNDFGKITITPDGKIYANSYHELLGTIMDDIRKLVYIEMDKGTSWRRLRDMKPCSDCVYQWLCPSPSNYELAIGKPNLCHIKV